MKKLLMGSAVLAIFSASLLVFQLSSCSKANAEQTVTHPIEGLWIGSYTLDGQANLGQQYFSFIIKPDGTMISDTKGTGQQHLAPGTWTLTGETLSCSVTYVYGGPQNVGIKQTSTATFDKTGKLTSGIWKNVAPASGSGTFTLTRIN